MTGKVRAKKKVKPTLEKEIRQEEDKEIESEERVINIVLYCMMNVYIQAHIQS